MVCCRHHGRPRLLACHSAIDSPRTVTHTGIDSPHHSPPHTENRHESPNVYRYPARFSRNFSPFANDQPGRYAGDNGRRYRYANRDRTMGFMRTGALLATMGRMAARKAQRMGGASDCHEHFPPVLFPHLRHNAYENVHYRQQTLRTGPGRFLVLQRSCRTGHDGAGRRVYRLRRAMPSCPPAGRRTFYHGGLTYDHRHTPPNDRRAHAQACKRLPQTARLMGRTAADV